MRISFIVTIVVTSMAMNNESSDNRASGSDLQNNVQHMLVTLILYTTSFKVNQVNSSTFLS